jgi:hypothetical protein
MFSEFPDFLNKAGFFLASRSSGRSWRLMILVMLVAIGWFFLERLRLRRRAARIGWTRCPKPSNCASPVSWAFTTT